MQKFVAPLRDIRFLLNEVFDFPSHYASLHQGREADSATVNAILEECARFCENVLSPLNQSGDEEACQLENGRVITPAGFKEAYEQYVAGGWQGLCEPSAYGGQDMPYSLGVIRTELVGTANWAFGMYPGLTMGAINTILRHAPALLQNRYLPPMIEGRWTGTMCLTEPQCGTDLGQVKTRADEFCEGRYKITGTKIFISAGEHDLAENIIHIVLARLSGAPAGTRGLSLFIVPKFLPTEGGSVGEFNHVLCSALEHKMGIRASATAVLNFGGSEAFLIGQPNKGLEAMFSFMNAARLGAAVQGVCHAELAYQGALRYAKDRRSMRALSGKKEPDSSADAIIHHVDVRRMLLTQKAIAEGGRAMIYSTIRYADHMIAGMRLKDEGIYKQWDDKLGFYTPIMKGFLTELGLEAANLGVQIFGGHGYIKEHGMEQIVRDARISTLYEGTTGIQALDLLGRKVLSLTRGRAVREFTSLVARFAAECMGDSRLRPFAATLMAYAAEWNVLTFRIMLAARRDRDAVGVAGHHFLMYSGYVMLGYFWVLQASVASQKLAGGGAEVPAFYEAKLATACFYFEHLLPRAKAHAASMVKPVRTLARLPVEAFVFE